MWKVHTAIDNCKAWISTTSQIIILRLNPFYGFFWQFEEEVPEGLVPHTPSSSLKNSWRKDYYSRNLNTNGHFFKSYDALQPTRQANIFHFSKHGRKWILTSHMCGLQSLYGALTPMVYPIWLPILPTIGLLGISPTKYWNSEKGLKSYITSDFLRIFGFDLKKKHPKFGEVYKTFTWVDKTVYILQYITMISCKGGPRIYTIYRLNFHIWI